MKERGILFTPTNYDLCVSGAKTQTRRIVKPEPLCDVEWFGQLNTAGPDNGLWFPMKGNPKDCDEWVQADGDTVRCPYGVLGDRMWVRETFSLCTKGSDALSGTKYDHPWYRADADEYGLLGHDGLGPVYAEELKWTPSIHMPKDLCRLWLEITEVRVQRIQEMEGQHPLDSDAIAEGVNRIHHGDGAYYYSAFRNEPHPKNWVDPTDAFKELWESINGPGSWDVNPWVWVLRFKVVST